MYLEIVYILLGIVLLMMGSKLFWLFVAGVGFLSGIEYAPLFLPGKPEYLFIIIALVLGMIGLILAFVIQKVGIGISGFAGGGYIALTILNAFGYGQGWIPWAVFFVGGIVGAILMLKLFNWALIVLSSIIGSFLIVKSMELSLEVMQLLFLGLCVIGIAAQASQGAAAKQKK